MAINVKVQFIISPQRWILQPVLMEFDSISSARNTFVPTDIFKFHPNGTYLTYDDDSDVAPELIKHDYEVLEVNITHVYIAQDKSGHVPGGISIGRLAPQMRVTLKQANRLHRIMNDLKF
ncbi:MAG: hypothetical protein F6K55_03095 [Moorea sp. SIO4A3]|nr:hypothetical protein [Moorena sp. SIO4A3]